MSKRGNSAFDDLILLYQHAHEELYMLQGRQASAPFSSLQDKVLRTAITARKRYVQALGAALAGQRLVRVGESLAPLGPPLLSSN